MPCQWDRGCSGGPEMESGLEAFLSSALVSSGTGGALVPGLNSAHVSQPGSAHTLASVVTVWPGQLGSMWH